MQYRLKKLRQGDIDGAKLALLLPIGSYYRTYGEKDGDPDIVAAIKEAAKNYPELAAEIAEKK
jgi:hypothetical protein